MQQLQLLQGIENPAIQNRDSAQRKPCRRREPVQPDPRQSAARGNLNPVIPSRRRGTCCLLATLPDLTRRSATGASAPNNPAATSTPSPPPHRRPKAAQPPLKKGADVRAASGGGICSSPADAGASDSPLHPAPPVLSTQATGEISDGRHTRSLCECSTMMERNRGNRVFQACALAEMLYSKARQA